METSVFGDAHTTAEIEAGAETLLSPVLSSYQTHGFIAKHLVQHFGWKAADLRALINTLCQGLLEPERRQVEQLAHTTRDRSFDLKNLVLEHWGQGGRFDQRAGTSPHEAKCTEALPLQLRALESSDPVEQAKAVAAIKHLSTQGLETPSSAIVDLNGTSLLVALLTEEADKWGSTTPEAGLLLLATLDTLKTLTLGSLKNIFAFAQAGAVERLVVLLEHCRHEVRKLACDILSVMAEDDLGVQYRIRSAAGVPCLMNLLQDDDLALRANAALTLRTIGSLPPQPPLRGQDPWEFLRS